RYFHVTGVQTCALPILGEYLDFHAYNREHTENYSEKVLAYARWNDDERLIVIANFDSEQRQEFELNLPPELMENLKIKDGTYSLKDQIYNEYTTQLIIEGKSGKIQIRLEPLQSLILKLN